MSAPIYSTVDANYFEQFGALLNNNPQGVDGTFGAIDTLIDPNLDINGVEKNSTTPFINTTSFINTTPFINTTEEASTNTPNGEASTTISKANIEMELRDRTPAVVKQWYTKITATKDGRFQYTCDIDGCNTSFVQKDKKALRRIYIRHLLDFAKRQCIKKNQRDSKLRKNQHTKHAHPEDMENIRIAIELQFALFEKHAKAHLQEHSKEICHTLTPEEIKARKSYRRSFRNDKDKIRIYNRKLKIRKALKKNRDLAHLDAEALEELVLQKYSKKFGNK